MVCQQCGEPLAATVTSTGAGAACLECGVAPQYAQSTISQPSGRGYRYAQQVRGAQRILTQTEQPTRSEAPPGTHPLTFTGTADEFFRIWIVNVFLTIVTLGIYNAWAKVRTRQYFYAHTRLAGHSFDYLANPVNILKGNLIVAAGLGLYYFTGSFAPEWNLVVVGVFYLVFPFLIFQSLRFRTRYSSYRNIRFHFHGTLGESYRVFLGLPFLLPFTLGLLFPYMMSRQKEYALGRFAFGTTRSKFHGGPGKFFKVYLLAALMGAAAFALLTFGAGALTEPFGNYGASLALIYLIVVPLFLLIQEYIYVSITNYCWEETQLGNVSLKSTLEVGPSAWIRLTNLLAIVVSAGLLIPWAKVRRTRYVVSNLAVVMRKDDLDNFIADESTHESSLGEVATDAFDIEIGL